MKNGSSENVEIHHCRSPNSPEERTAGEIQQQVIEENENRREIYKAEGRKRKQTRLQGLCDVPARLRQTEINPGVEVTLMLGKFLPLSLCQPEQSAFKTLPLGLDSNACSGGTLSHGFHKGVKQIGRYFE